MNGYDNRHNSTDKKQNGYFGPLKNANGEDVTEYSIGIEVNGKEVNVPSIVPTLTREELDTIMGLTVSGGKVPASILRKAYDFATSRIAENKSVFWEPGEDVYDLPKYEENTGREDLIKILNTTPKQSLNNVPADNVSAFIDKNK